jgi:hypothetical protein
MSHFQPDYLLSPQSGGIEDQNADAVKKKGARRLDEPLHFFARQDVG